MNQAKGVGGITESLSEYTVLLDLSLAVFFRQEQEEIEDIKQEEGKTLRQRNHLLPRLRHSVRRIL